MSSSQQPGKTKESKDVLCVLVFQSAKSKGRRSLRGREDANLFGWLQFFGRGPVGSAIGRDHRALRAEFSCVTSPGARPKAPMARAGGAPINPSIFPVTQTTWVVSNHRVDLLVLWHIGGRSATIPPSIGPISSSGPTARRTPLTADHGGFHG